MNNVSIRPGRAEDIEAMVAILPRLAEFELPPRRHAGDLWEDDAKALRAWAEQGDDNAIVLVADDVEAGVVGVAFVRLQPEFMSKAPSGHLEALAIAPIADGHGIGRRLLEAAEDAAKAAGAVAMTLHVFANNERARSVYDRHGYEGELLRYVKHLDASS